jgi:acyl-CoA synthetase (NDP forming)
VRLVIAQTLTDATQFLEAVPGRAVVLKALTQEHKARKGLVITNLREAAALEEAWRDLAARHPAPFLVQAQVAAGPELFVGFRRDQAFGPIVSLGFGGRFAERMGGHEVRLAPVDAVTAARMVEAVLGEMVDSIADLVANVSRMGVAFDRVLELDLNPVILSSDGACAVDLRVIEGESDSPPVERPGAMDAIRRMLEPRTVAVVGASANLEKPGGRALRYLRRLAPSTPVHGVNRRRELIDGVQTVAGIDELPTGIDVALVATPSTDVVGVLRQLAARRVGAAVVFASGFAETGDTVAEAAVRNTARELGIRVCGVNSNGLIGDVPLTFTQACDVTPTRGTVSFVTQSGAFGGSLLIRSWAVGLGTARYVCVGNQTDLDIGDYLEFLAVDDASRTVGVFLEGVADGRRLARAMESVTSAGKGLVVLRAGDSHLAAAAARSHTGVIAGSAEIYRQVTLQSGAVLATDLVDLVGICQALDWQPRATSRRVAIISTSGGAGSLLVDMVARRRLDVPQFETPVQARLRDVLPAFASVANPLDTTAAVTYDPALLGRMAHAALTSAQVDALLIAISTLTGKQADVIAEDIVAIAGETTKPLVVAWSLPLSTVPEAVAALRAARIPVYDSLAVATSALAALCP